MMTGKTVFVVCLFFALTHTTGARRFLLDLMEFGQDSPAARWLPLDDDDSIQNLRAESFHLDVNPNHIVIGQTELLTINCSVTLDQVSSMSGITSLIVSKSMGTENPRQEHFLDLVSVSVFTPNQITRLSQFDGEAEGRIDNEGVSFITIELSNPTDDQAGLFRCEVRGVDNLRYPTEVVKTKRVTSQHPNLDWLAKKVSQLQSQIEHQNTLANNQPDEISKLSTLAKNQSDEINTLSTLAKNQSDEITALSTLAKNQSDEINTLSTLAKNQSDEITALSTLAKNQSDEIDKLLSATKTQSEIISVQQSQLDSQSDTIAQIQKKLQVQGLFMKALTEFNMSSEYNGHFYLLSKQNWYDAAVAAETCQDYGAYLAQISNENENQFVKEFLDQHASVESSTILISGTDSQHEGRWTYSETDIDLVFTDWRKGEPNGGQINNCIIMSRWSQWQWHDWRCRHSFPNYNFLCEFESV